MLELYEQNRTVLPSHGNEAESSSGAGTANPPGSSSTACKSSAPLNAREGAQIPQNGPLGTQQASADGNSIGSHQTQNHSNEHKSAADNIKSAVWEHGRDGDEKDVENYEPGSSVSHSRETAVEAITKIDKDKVKAALEKRKKLRNIASKKNAVVDEDDLIERELENGIEMVAEDKNRKEERESSWPKPLRRLEQPPSQGRLKAKSFGSTEDGRFDDQGHAENAEEGELSSLDEHDFPFPKLQSSNGKVSGAKKRPDEKGWTDYSERDLKRMR